MIQRGSRREDDISAGQQENVVQLASLIRADIIFPLKHSSVNDATSVFGGDTCTCLNQERAVLHETRERNHR